MRAVGALFCAVALLGCADGGGASPMPSRRPVAGGPRDAGHPAVDAAPPFLPVDAGTDAFTPPDAPLLLIDCEGAEDGTRCIDPGFGRLGTCTGDVCCTGCLTGDLRCHGGTEETACGANGGWCDVCVTGIDCRAGLCGTGG